MKHLFTLIFIFFGHFGFSQTKNSQETKISPETLKKAVFIKDIVPEFKSNWDALSVQYTFSKKGKILIESTNNNEIPKSITDYTFNSGSVIYIEFKVKVLDNTKSPKIMAVTKKITIE